MATVNEESIWGALARRQRVWLVFALLLAGIVQVACNPIVVPTEDEATATRADEGVRLSWSGSVLPTGEVGEECLKMTLTDDSAMVGPCGGELTEVPLLMNHQQEWPQIATRFGSFQAESAHEQIEFHGQGNISGEAWERAITTWARITAAELASGRTSAAGHTIFAWDVGEVAEQAGLCQKVIVLTQGSVMAGTTPCDEGSTANFVADWLTTEEWETFDQWLYTYAPVYAAPGYMNGRGLGEIQDDTVSELSAWAAQVYTRVYQDVAAAQGESGLFLIIEDGKYGYVDQSGQVIVPPQYDNADRLIEGRAMVQIDGLWGFLDEDGREIVPPQYESVVPFAEGMASVMVDWLWGAIDLDGNLVIEPIFETPITFRDGMAHVSFFGKWGLIDTNNQVIVEPIYTWIGDFNHGLAVFHVRDSYGYLAPDGTVVIEPQYTEAYDFPADDYLGDAILAPVRVGEHFGYIDLEGNVVIEPKFAFADPFFDGLARVLEDYADPRYGYIDSSGEYVIPPTYELASPFSEGLAAVQVDTGDKGYKYGYINMEGNLVIEPQFDQAYPFSEGMAVFAVFEGEMYRFGFVNYMGEIVVGPIYESAFPFSEGLAAVGTTVDARYVYGYIRKDGTFMAEPQFDAAGEFSHQRARVMVDSKFGYIDAAGNLSIPYRFDDAHAFGDNGLAAVRGGDLWGYIDRSGNFDVDPMYDAAFTHVNGIARFAAGSQNYYVNVAGERIFDSPATYSSDFHEGFANVWIDNKMGIIDKTGAMVLPPIYDGLGMFNQGRAWVQMGGLFGYIDTEGNYIVEPIYQVAQDFSNGRAAVFSGDKWGAVDLDGKLVIEPQFQGITAFDTEGYAAVMVDNKWGIIDRDGNIVVDPRFDGYAFSHFGQPVFADGLTAVAEGEMWGYIDSTGDYVIEPKFRYAENFVNGVARVEITGHYGLIDRQGNFIYGPVAWPDNLYPIERS